MTSRELVRLAHSDAWQELGRLFEGRGGGVAEHRNVRLMASGLPHPQWNSGDVLGGDVDLDLVRAFYAAYGVPWGLRVPAELAWSHGRHVLRLRLMGLSRSDFRPVPPSPGFRLQPATAADLNSIARVDAVAFGSDLNMRPWFEALLSARPDVVSVVRALSDDQTVGIGYSVFADGLAGRTVYVAGIAVSPVYRRRGCGGALSSWLVRRGFDAGATLAHLHPDDEDAARLYGKLGFVETPGLDVYVDL